MYTLNATIKAPLDQVEALTASLKTLGVDRVAAHTVSYQQFLEESRLNWDCVFPEMWTERKPVAYLDFSFEDSDAGRAAAYEVEFHLPQIPLNLRYDPAEGNDAV